MKEYIKLIRPHQWVKNGFILLPLFFALHVTDFALLRNVILVALAFSLIASGIYILNDYFDIEADKKHPTKKTRPLAAGTVKVPAALGLMFFMWAAGILVIALISPKALIFTGIYIAINLGYSFGLKHIPILDVNFIAIGFVLRLFIGEAAANGMAPLTMWIVLMTFLLALFLGLAKRRDDVLLSMEGKQVRKAIDGYNLEFINGAMMIMASVVIMCYILYTTSTPVQMGRPNADKLWFTTFFVLLGILRYMQITFVEQKSGSPTKVLLRDLFLQLTIAGWLATFGALLYF